MVLVELTNFIIGLVASLGYVGVFIGMLIETVFMPLPSEVVMPLAGYVASISGIGYIGLLGMIIAGTFGTVVGAIIIYYAAFTAGRHFLVRYGKYMFVDEKKLSVAERWFDKHGKMAIFLGRMAPGIRELISIPAGLSKMDIKEFLLFTFAGSFVWTSVLGLVGYLLGESWGAGGLPGITSLIASILIMCLITYFLFRILVKKIKK
ncbi:MAG TPA: DedA family protein [archaeon]|nr:DedA family protein [archaeon]